MITSARPAERLPERAGPTAGANRTRLLCALALAIVTLALYSPVAGFDFTNYDDPDYVTYNPMVNHGLTWEGVKWAFTHTHSSNWHPLTWISHMADCSLFGMRPGAHHVVNALFHTANVLLLFLLLDLMTGARWRSALVAALFAWHPLHVESVAWISERKDVLSTLFWLLTLLAYRGYAVKSKRWCYAAALVGFALGLLSKPMVVTLPITLLLLDFWPLGRMSGKDRVPLGRLVLEKLPFFVLSAVVCWVTIKAQGGANSIVAAAALPWSERLANAAVSCVLYLGKMVWPADLAVPYPYSQVWTFGQAAGAAIFLLAVTGAVIWRWRTQPHLAMGWLWFLATLAPVIGLVQVGIQFMADRYTYVPLIGVFIMAAWSIPAAWARWPRPGFVLGAAGAAVLGVMVLASSVQIMCWHDSVTLFTQAVEVTENNILAEYNLGEALARAGKDDEATEHYRKALAMKPNRVEALYNSQQQARFNLGLLCTRHGQIDEAEILFRACLKEEPALALAHVALGNLLMMKHQPDGAVNEYQEAARLSGGRELGALAGLDQAYATLGKFVEAAKAAGTTRDAALAQGRKDLADAAGKRMEAYQTGRKE